MCGKFLDHEGCRKQALVSASDCRGAVGLVGLLDGDLDRAVPVFEKLAVLFPTVPNAFDSLGEAYLRQGDKTKAAKAFERCLELDPEHDNAQRRLAELKAKP